MTEAQTIHDDALPLTVDVLAEGFAACGLSAGQTVLVHSSMSRLGWIAGGPVAVIQALLRVLTPAGTLMMPTHTTQNTDPSCWQNPPVPESWWQIIRDHNPGYDPAIYPTRLMGAIAELFRTWPGVKRSSHPVGSFAALGPNADILLNDHRLDSMFGEHSPIARLYDLDGDVMLLGVHHDNNTSLHLAEYRTNFSGKASIQEGSAVLVDGARQWINYEIPTLDTDDFQALGLEYEREHHIPIHKIGQADVRLMKQRPLIDWAVGWMERNRADVE